MYRKIIGRFDGKYDGDDGFLDAPAVHVRTLGALEVGPRDTASSMIPTQMHPLR